MGEVRAKGGKGQEAGQERAKRYGWAWWRARLEGHGHAEGQGGQETAGEGQERGPREGQERGPREGQGIEGQGANRWPGQRAR